LTSSLTQRLAIAAVVVTAAMPISSASAQRPVDPLHLLDVPYLPQSELLCGGAAVAMVMRYWGTTNVYAETFAGLVDPAAGGIRAEDLLAALRARGWTADSFRGEAGGVQERLRARQPVIVLIQDRPGRFHYVVVVGWSSGRVIVHDPARAPFRVLDEDAFEAAWRESDYWSVAPTPPAAAPGRAASDSVGSDGTDRGSDRTAPTIAGPCDGMVDEGVRLAGAGDAAGARRIFEITAEICPDASGPWREMAGLHALGSDWRAAALDAGKALERDPADALAARILATALFLDNDVTGALGAWNRVGEPVIDLVKVTGLQRTRYRVAERAISLAPRSMLTPRALQLARRRLGDLPSAQTTRVGFTPAAGGRARVDAVVVERPVAPRSPVALTALGLHALSERELAIGVASPTGGGELWRASWRWWEHRPRLAVGFEAPAPFGGVWGVSLFGERQSYARGGRTLVESRRRAELTIGNWTTRGLRWEGAIALDRMRDDRVAAGGRAIAVAGAALQRLAGDRAYVEARASYWAGDLATSAVSLRSEWRSRTTNEGQVAIARAGIDRAQANAPLALWPGAGTGHGRDVLLRAHPLLDDGIVQERAFGERLLHAGFEWRRWLQPRGKPLRFAPAMFLDAARAFRPLDGLDRPSQFDVGAGVRLAVPGSGVLRVDVAHGLRDGRNALSIGWTR
jgi:hypothetical protein